MSETVADRSNYLNKDILYLKNTSITEYDMKSSGLSIIKEYGLLDADTIASLEALPKEERNVSIGRMQIQNHDLRLALATKIKEIIRQFASMNDIKASDVLSIKKDALFIIKKEPKILTVGTSIEFRPKGVYTSYAYLSRKEFYYNSLTDVLDIKGISSDVTSKCGGVLSDIKRIFRQGEALDWKSLYEYLRDYREQYLTRDLPVESYRSLLTGTYKMVASSVTAAFDFDDMSDDDRHNISISDNYVEYILPLLKAML